MSIRNAIFISVASAGVVATGWLGGTAAGPASAPPATNVLAARHAVPPVVAARSLVSGAAVQLVGGPDYAAADYPRTLQAAVDGSFA